MQHKILTTSLLLALAACTDLQLVDSSGDADTIDLLAESGDTETDSVDNGTETTDGDGDIAQGVSVDMSSDELFIPGQLWGPCPMSDVGTIDLCDSEMLACVPADGGAANVCLPIGGCPAVVPMGLFSELGWGGACYPRCEFDSECLIGQVCAVAIADGSSMCAWPMSG